MASLEPGAYQRWHLDLAKRGHQWAGQLRPLNKLASALTTDVLRVDHQGQVRPMTFVTVTCKVTRLSSNAKLQHLAVPYIPCSG